MHAKDGTLLATVFVTGACVLVIEILGTRLLAPFFGSGIYTWSALISITLAALALGYWLGGMLADHRPDTRWLYALCLLAGCWTILTPALARLVLPALLPWEDSRPAVLVSGVVLFFPSLFLLGTMGPFAIRLITRHASIAGTSSGRVFAVSTLGSLLAALATGFLLIPNFGTRALFSCTGTVLLVLALVGLRDLRWILAGLAAAGTVAAAAFWTGVGERGLDRVEVIDHVPSFYGELHVIGRGNQLALLADGIGQNYVNRAGSWTTPYLAFLGSVPKLSGMPLHSAPAALVIGLGAGQLPMLLEGAGFQVTAVEIDPKVGKLARQHFGFTLTEDRVHYLDGRQFLAQPGGKFAYIVLDAFNGEQIAWHLTSREALQLTKSRLSAGGMLGINLSSADGEADVASLQATLRAVFPEVRVFSDPRYQGLRSFVFLASTRPITLTSHPPTVLEPSVADIRAFLGNELPDLGGQLVLTDDYNPINEQRRGVHRLFRHAMHSWIGKDSLLVFLD